MARVVGIQKLDFDAKKLKKTFSKNSGKDISTEDIKLGWSRLKGEIDSDMINKLKQSPYYIKGVNG